MHLTRALYFKAGIVAGIKKFIKMQAVGLGLVKARRMNHMEAVGGGHKCKDIQGIHAMLVKAKELEARRKESIA